MPYGYFCHLDRKIGVMKRDLDEYVKPKSCYAQHYTGFVDYDLPARMHQHRVDPIDGASLLYHAHQLGVGITIVRAWWFPWPYPWLFERGLKELRRGPDLCPHCNPGSWFRVIPQWSTVLEKGIRAVRRMPGKENYRISDQAFVSMVNEVQEIPVAHAWRGVIPEGVRDDPFDAGMTRAQHIQAEREAGAIEARRRHRGQPIELPERPYIHVEGEINY